LSGGPDGGGDLAVASGAARRGATVEGLRGQSQALDELVQRRAGKGENQGFVAIRALTRPKAAQANREDGIAGDPMLRYCTASSGKPAPFQEKSPPGKR
jgi:hypothetical protein